MGASWTIGGHERDERFRCVATARRTGDRCTKAACRGSTLCKSHGGASFELEVRELRWALEDAVDEHLRRLGVDVALDRSRG